MQHINPQTTDKQGAVHPNYIGFCIMTAKFYEER